MNLILLSALIIVVIVVFDTKPYLESRFDIKDWRTVFFPRSVSSGLGNPDNGYRSSFAEVGSSQGKDDRVATPSDKPKSVQGQPVHRSSVGSDVGELEKRVRGGAGWHYCRGSWKRDPDCSHGEEDRFSEGYGELSD